ncbi:DUF928 domain-containing protein [Leptothermofonsia sichuanensis E412]|uniref:DUF928 domain-containing protein n=1 Tax=Leptothermofonsia sichuanensis TaxID=2917832 RepID=UPI001CA7308A|nr:DUF928 domain-containing protein [Leptothermofonsia sichuanensis]QZZ18880.1 DUF928 domain-containing protein [Leptothermofonsia sichuanensis E412]
MTTPRFNLTVATGIASSLLCQQILGFSGPLPGFSGMLTSVGLGSSALAAPRYTPRTDNGKAPKRTVGTGSRGCVEVGGTPTGTLSLLVPNEQIGYTTASHPTFFWHLSSEIPVPMVFSLVEINNPVTIFEQEISQSKAGINKVQLPEDKPPLEPGKKYRWNVALVCNPQRRSADVIAQANIQRESVSADLEKRLAAASSAVKKAEIYAAQGFWYDALSMLAIADSEPDQEAIWQDGLALLKQVGLANVVKQEQQRLQSNR